MYHCSPTPVTTPIRLAWIGLCACILQIWWFHLSSRLRWWTTICLAPFSQSPQYISDPQHGGSQTDVYWSVRMWRHCATSLSIASITCTNYKSCVGQVYSLDRVHTCNPDWIGSTHLVMWVRLWLTSYWGSCHIVSITEFLWRGETSTGTLSP